MKRRSYKRLIKKLDKIYEQLRKIQPYGRQESYSNMKVKLYQVIKSLRNNTGFWSK